ncbi:MAG: hypothetical protein KAT20_05300 [Desulfuromonadales bacterium]|nr:hypothetical protein [Desulfuromonadales bacterium]
MTDLLKSVTLEGGLVVNFYDQSNRYFGDFHRICIKVVAELVLLHATDEPEPPLVYERTLERMGVTTAALETEKSALIDSFLSVSRTYLENPNFPEQLLRKKKSEKTKPVFLRHR